MSKKYDDGLGTIICRLPGDGYRPELPCPENSPTGLAIAKIADAERLAKMLTDRAGLSTEMIQRGVPDEQFENICTNIICKYNLRTLSELARSRAGGRTQDEYRAVVRCMTEKVLAVQPWAAYFLFPEDCDLIEELEKLANVVKMGGQVKASTEILKVCDQLRKRG